MYLYMYIYIYIEIKYALSRGCQPCCLTPNSESLKTSTHQIHVPLNSGKDRNQICAGGGHAVKRRFAPLLWVFTSHPTVSTHSNARITSPLCVCVRVRVCFCVFEREREGGGERKRERESQRKRATERG